MASSIDQPVLGTSVSKRIGSGHITLEALLDSPSLTPPSPLSESVTESGTISTLEPIVMSANHALVSSVSLPSSLTCNRSDTQAFAQPNCDSHMVAHQKACMREVCMELVTVLRTQDVSGYFLSPKVHTSGIGLLELEKRVLKDIYTSLKDFQTDVLKSIGVSSNVPSTDPLLHTESQRLITLASDWFASLPADLHQFLKFERHDSVSGAKFNSATKLGEFCPSALHDIPRETHLGVLNPDNQGVIGPNERVRTIGEEVGPLQSGTGLLPHGGYREDRRNKVVPYTYLDYGPYYSFAPRFDSGASYCTPEANQLVLGTSWLPARLAYLSTPSTAGLDSHRHEEDSETDGAPSTTPPEDVDEITRAINSDLVSAALAQGDQSLAIALAVAEMDQVATSRLSSDLLEILPGPEVEDDSCVFALCLANALTRDWLRERRKMNSKKVTEFSCDLDNSCDGEEEMSHATTEMKQSVTNSTESDYQGCEDSVKADTSISLSDTAADLRLLHQAQYRRLGESPQTNNQGVTPTTGGSWPQLHPSSEEKAAAHRLAGGLIRLAGRARPRDIVHPYTVRRAMGLSPTCAPIE